MSDELIAKAAKWLETRHGPGCPKCGTKQTISGVVSGAKVVDDGLDMTQGYPMVLVICNNCAYTEQYSAVVMGIL